MQTLARTVRLPGAVLLGLGAILGTGVFVSWGLAAERTGPSVVLALALAGVVASFNGLSSAQLAAAFPVSGGTYEYANRTIGPATGFTAGWMFLAAKSASAATAALGVVGYGLELAGLPPPGYGLRVGLAVGVVAAVTGLVLAGLRRSNQVNTGVVLLTVGGLLLLVGVAAPVALQAGPEPASRPPFLAHGVEGLLGATALSFVAYTGYGRVATLGEEVLEPRRTIPRAVIATLVVTAVLYLLVSATAVGVLGAGEVAEVTRNTAAPLQHLATTVGGPGLAGVISVAALTAMVGVLLNLVLGLSRVVLAMGRRGDLPAVFARVDAGGTTPGPAVLAVGGLIGGLALLGEVQITWSFSAFTVLVYYALTNLSALRMPAEARRYPRWVSVAGLVSCLGLAWWVEPEVWAVGLLLLGVGHVVRAIARRRSDLP